MTDSQVALDQALCGGSLTNDQELENRAPIPDHKISELFKTLETMNIIYVLIIMYKEEMKILGTYDYFNYIKKFERSIFHIGKDILFIIFSKVMFFILSVDKIRDNFERDCLGPICRINSWTRTL